MPNLNFWTVWFALSLLRFRLQARLPMMFILWMVAIIFFIQAEDGIRDKLVTGVQTCALPISVDIAKRAIQAARLQAYDVVLLDTAGRLHVDDQLMGEMKAVAAASQPTETLLVVDALTGQDAVNVAKAFAGEVDLTGVILTRLDGDARGGAALSMRAVTGKPIKFAGVGEALDKLEAFHPERVAGRILGMGDVVSLVERAAETIQVEEAEKLAAKMAK